MIRGLYTAASGMISQQIMEENLSNNIANMNTPGFKSDNVDLKSFKQYLVENHEKFIGNQSFPNQLGYMEFGVGVDQTSTDFSQGTLDNTGRNLDFAINGNGFFTVMGPNGSQEYTRDGSFQIDPNGYLTTTEGDKVLGVDANGNKVPIQVTNSDIKLLSDGTLQNTNGSLKFDLSTFSNSNSLVKNGNNYYTSSTPPTGAANGTVIQGSLERSNVNPIDAITQMMTIMRDYESNQKVIQAMDDTLDKSVNVVGNVQ